MLGRPPNSSGMPEEWNSAHDGPGAAIEDVDQSHRYNVKVGFQKIENFETAREEMQRQEALRLWMPCTTKQMSQDTRGGSTERGP